MPTPLATLTGALKGCTSAVLVAVHGNESCGIDAALELFPELRITRGTVLFVIGNPEALRRGVRYIDADLNRLFRAPNRFSNRERQSYEFCRAKELRAIIEPADALLDVHASFCKISRPFLICEPNSYQLVSKLPFPLVVSGFDAVQPGGADYFMNKKGGMGITAECGFLGDPSAAKTAKDIILAFLVARQHIQAPHQLPRLSKTIINVTFMYTTKTNTFRLVREFRDFENLDCGDIVGFDGDSAVKMPINGVIVFAQNRNVANAEAFVVGERARRFQ